MFRKALRIYTVNFIGLSVVCTSGWIAMHFWPVERWGMLVLLASLGNMLLVVWGVFVTIEMERAKE